MPPLSYSVVLIHMPLALTFNVIHILYPLNFVLKFTLSPTMELFLMKALAVLFPPSLSPIVSSGIPEDLHCDGWAAQLKASDILMA